MICMSIGMSRNRYVSYSENKIHVMMEVASMPVIINVSPYGLASLSLAVRLTIP